MLWAIALISTIYVSILNVKARVNSNIDISPLTTGLLVFSWIFTAVMAFVYVSYPVAISKVTNYHAELIKKCKTSTNGFQSQLVSIIIPAHNEQNVIAKTIDNLLSQSYKKIEIIIVCHNCTDNTFEQASRIADSRVKPYELKTDNAGKGLALNYAVNLSVGEYIFVIDADNRLDQNFIENMIPLLAEGFAAAQGKFMSLNRGYNTVTEILSLELELFSTPMMAVRHYFQKRTPLGGSGFMIKKAALKAVGGFSNSLVDDYELSFRLYRSGYRVAFAPLCIDYAEMAPQMSVVFKQRSRWVKGFMDNMRHKIAEPRDIMGNIIWINPLSMFSALFSIIIGAVTAICFVIFGEYPYKFSYVPFVVWIGLQIAITGLQTVILRNERRFVSGRDLLLLGLATLFANYWYAVMLRALFVKTWASTKTAHGFEVRESVEQPART
jgi:cellulose synthase/poly-beta-1,6-N-acetylglucosamine synthase-like glycosyltransferase